MLKLAAASAALVAVLALTGCGLLGGSGAPEPANTGDNGAATSGPAPVDGATDGATVPATFPADIPLIDGQVLDSADLGTGWVVLFGVEDADASFVEAADALVAAGLTEDIRQQNDGQGFANYTGPLYQVQLSSNVDYPGYGQAVNYTVVKNGE